MNNFSEAQYIESILLNAIFSDNKEQIRYATNIAWKFLSKEQREREEARKVDDH